MLTTTAILSINLYQKHISPHKGYCCAYGVYHDTHSCLEYLKQTIKELGVVNSILKIKQRFKECKKASEYIENEYKDMRKDDHLKVGRCENCPRCGNDAYSAAACFSLFIN